MYRKYRPVQLCRGPFGVCIPNLEPESHKVTPRDIGGMWMSSSLTYYATTYTSLPVRKA